MSENGLLGKLHLISKFMTSYIGKQIIAIHILPRISRSKISQAMKFGLLKEYKKRKNFVSKIMQKMRWED